METPTYYSKFLNESLLKQQHIFYLDVGLSKQKIDETEYHQQNVLFVGTDINLMVTN